MRRGIALLMLGVCGAIAARAQNSLHERKAGDGSYGEILQVPAAAGTFRMTAFVDGRRSATDWHAFDGEIFRVPAKAGTLRMTALWNGQRWRTPARGAEAQTVATGVEARTVADGPSARTIAVRAGAGPQAQSATVTVDGIAARIEGDIVAESQLNELAGFQKLVEGKAGSRADLLRELTDQWIVNAEAQTARFGRPKTEDVTQAFNDLEKRFASAEAFQKAIVDAGLTETAVRRQLELQIFLARFLDYKFRPAAQVNESDIQEYYKGEFTKLAQARGEPVPPLDDVHTDIRRLLTEKIINQRAEKWLDETRPRLRVEVFAAPDKS